MTNTNTWNFTSNAEGRSIWQLVNNAGDIIGQSSQTFASKAGAEYNAKLLGYKDSFSKQLTWDFFQLNNLWHWTCHNTVNKEEVGKSYNGFQSESDAMDNAALFGFDSNGYVMKTVVAAPNAEMPKVTMNADIPKTNINFTAPAMGAAASVGGIATAVNIPKMSSATVDVKASTPKVAVAQSNVNVSMDDEGWLTGIWKWLLPLILVLAAIALLWWLLNGMNKTTVTAPDINMTKPSLSSATASKLGNVMGGLSLPQFSTLSTALKASGLEGTLNGFGPFTLLAPTNSAFAALPAGTVDELLKVDKLPSLQNLLKLHVLPGNIDLSTLKDGDMVTALSGEKLKATLVDGKLNLGSVEGIDTTKVSSENGINVYALPEVLAVTEKAMEKTIEKVVSSSSAPAMEKALEKAPDLKVGYFLNAAKADGRFGTLLSLIKANGLESALDQAGPFTVFAPTDEAFASLGQDTLTSLQKPENKAKLVEILKYHVVPGKNDFAKFGANTELTTLNGNKVTLGLDDHGQGIVKGSKNTALAPVEDINTDNAIIHVLTDSPLLQ